MTSALQVADYLRRTQRIFGEMHLQKLLYYSQAWNLAWTGKPLFSDEIQAWAMGPVVPGVWADAKYGHQTIVSENLPASDRAVVDAVCAFYATNNGSDLSSLTHGEGPWQEARGDTPSGDRSTAPVSQASMRRFYTRQSVEQENGPTRPLCSTTLPAAVARSAAEDQRRRWREALDALAHI